MTVALEILNLIETSRTYLDARSGESGGTVETVEALTTIPSDPNARATFPPCIPGHADVLDLAIDSIENPGLQPLKQALQNAQAHLHWRIDDHTFYESGVDIGESYLNGNMHCLLIGPNGTAFRSDTFLFGFFLLAPQLFYRDHNHLAPELYVTLTGPTSWRFGPAEPWTSKPAGSVVWNPSMRPHAMRTHDTPFFAMFSWTDHVDQNCILVPADDWDEIDASLATA